MVVSAVQPQRSNPNNEFGAAFGLFARCGLMKAKEILQAAGRLVLQHQLPGAAATKQAGQAIQPHLIRELANSWQALDGKHPRLSNLLNQPTQSAAAVSDRRQTRSLPPLNALRSEAAARLAYSQPAHWPLPSTELFKPAAAGLQGLSVQAWKDVTQKFGLDLSIKIFLMPMCGAACQP